MGCFEADDDKEPLWAANLKDYDTAELETLIGYIDSTTAWFETNGLNNSGTEDIVGFRVGAPVYVLGETLEITTLYTANDDLDQLIKSISLDAFKISVKTDISGVEYSQTYTFKSSFHHNIFEKYFHEGVENLSGFAYLDNSPMNLSDVAPLPVKYGGAVSKALSVLPMPDDIYACMVYVMQNTTLYVTAEESAVTSKGAITYYNTKAFYDHLKDIKSTASKKIARMATPYQEDIHELMVYLGVDEAFRNIQFGGDFDDMRIVMRIPTSRSNQLTLEGLLGEGDVFNDIFKVKIFDHTSRDIKDNEKKEDLEDVYSMDKLDFQELDDSIDGYYGCKEGNNYRYWYVADEWLDSLTAEQLAIVFWMGLDLMTERGDPCPYDELLSIIIVIVLTFTSAGLGAGTALTVSQGITVLSGILSIGAITGVIDTKLAAILGVVLAIATFGTSMLNSGVTVTAAFKQLMAVASKVLDTLKTLEMVDFQEEMEEMEDKLESLIDDADLWESEFRFMYGDSFEMGVRSGPEADPYKYIKDTYEAFSTYKTPGFQ